MIHEPKSTIYLINEEDKTACVISNNKVKGETIIPKSIYYESNEYIVVSILKHAFLNSQIQSIKFSNDSKIKTIKGKAFCNSSIESLSIPKSLIDLDEGWCAGTSKLTRIDVDQNNPRYSKFDGKMIIGKSSLESSNYDTIVFCNRDVKEVAIPKFIKHIDSHSFGRCNQINQLDIQSDSELQTIGNHAFFKSSIERFIIPSHVTKIDESAFSRCSQLEIIKIQPDSELEVIDKYAFHNSSIMSFTIPPHLKKISEYTFLNCNKLKEIKITTDSEIRIIEEKAFFDSSIESLTIPKSLIDLNDGWCAGALKLTRIDVDQNNPRYSKFDGKMIIGKSSLESSNYDTIVFCNRDVKEVAIPKFIKQIGSHSFEQCNQLHQLDIPLDSELQTIGNHAFFKSSIEKFIIPSHITNIGKYAFAKCEKLQIVDISYDSELQEICKHAFSESSLNYFLVSRHITKIDGSVFENCKKLKRIDILADSQLKEIGKNAFCNSSIESLMIPESLINLDDKWCAGTFELNRIDVDPNNPRYSNFDGKMIVGKSTIEAPNYDTIVFCNRDVELITVPNFIKYIGQYAFENCQKLQTVEITADSELQKIDQLAFYNSSIESLMIPKSLIDLEYGWCIGILYLNSVDVDPNNPKYSKFDDKIIIGKSSLESSIYDTLVFCNRDVKTITIPKFIKHIGHNSLEYCTNLRKVEFTVDSELQTINSFAFNNSIIEKFTIPPHVTFIGKYAFSCCNRLNRIDFSADSKLTTIEEYAFFNSGIESFIIPCHVKQIGKSAFLNCDNLQIIEIDENAEIEKFDQYLFDCKNAIIMIPSNLNYYFRI